MKSVKQDYNVPGDCPSCDAIRVKRRRVDGQLYCAACGDTFSQAEFMQHQWRRNGVRHCPNAGLARRIRESVRGSPANCAALAQRLGATIHAVRAACQTMVNVSGGLDVVPGTFPPVYCLPGSRRKCESMPSDGSFALPISVGRGYRWFSEHR